MGTRRTKTSRQLAEVDGVFVGSCLKVGNRDTRVDIERVRDYVRIVASLK